MFSPGLIVRQANYLEPLFCLLKGRATTQDWNFFLAHRLWTVFCVHSLFTQTHSCHHSHEMHKEPATELQEVLFVTGVSGVHLGQKGDPQVRYSQWLIGRLPVEVQMQLVGTPFFKVFLIFFLPLSWSLLALLIMELLL